LREINLKVKVIVLDQESSQRSTFKYGFGVSPEEPWLHLPDDAINRIYVIWDPPHLLKNIRNNLKRHNLKVLKIKKTNCNSFTTYKFF
jgi:hypothetical protein